MLSELSGDRALSSTGVLIWRYGTTAGARTTNSGVKHKFSGARASYKLTVCIPLTVTELWL